jgi:hypothetical protein
LPETTCLAQWLISQGCPSKFCSLLKTETSNSLTVQKWRDSAKHQGLLDISITLLALPCTAFGIWRYAQATDFACPQDFTVDCCRSPAAPWVLRYPCVLRLAHCWPLRPVSPRSPWGSSAAQRFSEPMLVPVRTPIPLRNDAVRFIDS